MLKRVYLEITNSCNLDCLFCSNKKGNNFLSLEEIENYIVQIKKHCNYIYLHILGEPLLHPNFEEILDLLDKNSMNLQLVTNGTLLYKYPNLLKHNCLRKLSISIHSINNFNINKEYFNVIDSIIESNLNTQIELRFYNQNNLAKQANDYLDYLKNKYIFQTTSKENSYKITNNTYVYFNDFFKWPNINDNFISNIGTCKGAIDMIAINSNSDITICCLDPYAYNKIGNLKEESLDEILKSDKYLKFINDFKNNKITAELCSKCSYRLRF